MRSALSQLREIRAVWAVEPVLAINLDSSSVVPAGAGAFAQEVFLGSVSKLLPFAYVMGRPAHAGAPFDGISAALIAAELLCELEANPRYADEDGPCMGIPPVALRAGDLKRHYDVTMPERAFLAFNVLTGTRTPGELLKQVADACENALQRASALMHSRADRCGARYAIGQGRVLTLDELRTTLHAGGVDMQMLDRLQPDERTGNVLDATRGVVERLVNCADLHGPLVVIGFAPVFYPLSRVHPAHEAAVRADLDAVATEIGIQLRYEPLFTGISDMSFLGAALSPAAFAAWQRNTAGGERWVINADASAGLGVAVLNIGPSGRDYHQRTERVHMPLSFEQAPALIWGLLRRTLARE
jgi:arginine utilization protein RocB